MLDQLDLRLYAILDPEHAGGHAPPELARKLAAGGVTLVQLRDKKSDPRAQVTLARAVKAALGEVPLIINDHVDVAIESGAAGVHLGQDDTDVATARMWGKTTWRWRTPGDCLAPMRSSGFR